MALTAEKSTLAAAVGTGVTVESVSGKGEVIFFYVNFTQSAAIGDANSTIDLVVLPPGKWRYVADLSKLYYSAFGAARTLDVGFAVYTEPDGDIIAASQAAIDLTKDVAAAGSYAPGGALTADGTLLINSKTPVTIYATCKAATLQAGSTIKGLLAFMR